MQNLVPVDLPFGRLTKWRATSVDGSTGHIFCHLSEPSISNKYERIFHSITGLAKAGRLQKRAVDPVVGEFCLAQNQLGLWYRSQITHVDNLSRQTEVYLVDFGNSEVVSFNLLI